MRPVKRSFAIQGHKTSISLEDRFWDALRDIAAARGVSLAEQVASIDATRGEAGLSSAVRVYILDWYQTKAGRGDFAMAADQSSTAVAGPDAS